MTDQSAFLKERVWLGWLERAWAPAGSQIRLEPFQVPAGAVSYKKLTLPTKLEV
jgi:hypothetical protein